jgi:hypothetical protein
MQAINALVTSLDCLHSFPSVLQLAMNKLTSSMYVAFSDRAKLKVSVSLPILEARYEILKGCLMELLHVGIVWDHDVFCDFHNIYNMHNQQDSLSEPLLKCAKAAEALSAWSLPQVPS